MSQDIWESRLCWQAFSASQVEKWARSPTLWGDSWDGTPRRNPDDSAYPAWMRGKLSEKSHEVNTSIGERIHVDLLCADALGRCPDMSNE